MVATPRPRATIAMNSHSRYRFRADFPSFARASESEAQKFARIFCLLLSPTSAMAITTEPQPASAPTFTTSTEPVNEGHAGGDVKFSLPSLKQLRHKFTTREGLIGRRAPPACADTASPSSCLQARLISRCSARLSCHAPSEVAVVSDRLPSVRLPSNLRDSSLLTSLATDALDQEMPVLAALICGLQHCLAMVRS